MPSDWKLQIRLGSGEEEELAEFLGQAALPPEFDVEFREGQSSNQGLAYTLPPEVAVLLNTAAAAAASAVGAGLGKLLWDRLKSFFKKPRKAPRKKPKKPRKEVVIVVAARRYVVAHPEAMDEKPPAGFLKLFEPGT